MDGFVDVLMILALTLATIGLSGLGVIMIATAFNVSLPLGFLAIFLIGMLIGIVASSFSH